MLVQKLVHAFALGARRSPFAGAIKSALRRGSPLEAAIDYGRHNGWDGAAQWLLSPSGRTILQDASLHSTLTHDINRDVDTELLLTAVRKRILSDSTELLRQPMLVDFTCALIQQCMNNEYVWFVAPDEDRRIAELKSSLVHATGSRGRPWQSLAALAMYEPLPALIALEPSDLDRCVLPSDMPTSIQTVFVSRLDEYREEAKIKASLPSFGAITDPVSQAVAGMYEQYPYPRWVDIVRRAPGDRAPLLHQFFADEELQFLSRPFKVLVAGCGTGRKAIQVAMAFGEHAEVWAADLSRASLAYGARMARRYGVSNMKFLQIDILDIPQLHEQFDVIECTGVLHHMKDPIAGGRALVSALRPGGIIHISVYSELARREIVRLRQPYEHRMSEVTTSEIRTFRWRLMLDSPATIDGLPSRSDFFDLNRCKDLLFHVSERRYTIPQLREYLDALGLEFRGLEQPGLLQNHYWTFYPSQRYRLDLDRWWAFEQRYPDAFQQLYETWCLKPLQLR